MLVAALCAVVLPASAAAEEDGNQIYLPEPDGPYQPGTSLVHLVDDNRVDDLAPDGGDRELMAQVWYPAMPSPWHQPAPYAQPQEAAAIEYFYGLPEGAVKDAATNSLLGAPALPGDRPVVFFYHGICASRTDTTALNERLASNGFVVVALASTHESDGVEFPDGRFVRTSDPDFCLAGGDPFSEKYDAVLNRLQETRVGDVGFVLDQLTEWQNTGRSPLPLGVARSLDLDRVGIMGHSFGGSTAAQSLADDPRLDAGVDLDGLIVGSVRKAGLDKPFLVIGSDYHDEVQDPSWADFLPALTGWHQWLRLVDAGHYRFVDIGGSAGKWGLAEMMPPEAWTANFGDIGDHRSQDIVLDYTTAFFQRFLAGKKSPILDGPSAEYPEIEFKTAGG
ncbi:hypothetical protein BAY61_02470 [Prauserella marina]|uniref:alpha/beta hydrolase family protein n=1 Tax=Prauserella marina TaxID=530584 RepID=UPI000B8D576F|nr:hypothetical protein [Prauserella marina]ASR38895.1 hypothetical protein BAY61_02470 [Prauserella marina]